MFDVLNELLRSFDRNYSELVEQNKQMIMQFFTNTRDLEGTFNSTLVQLGQKLYEEKYNVEVSSAEFKPQGSACNHNGVFIARQAEAG